MQALRDVELAVDDQVLSRGGLLKTSQSGTSGSGNRRGSTNRRVSERDNPFMDISPRLGSRRVRPIVLELLHALGHYIDAVWCIENPGVPCPWVFEGVHSNPHSRQNSSSNILSRGRSLTGHIQNTSPIGPRQSLKGKEADLGDNASSRHWQSRVITAVQEGKASGYVIDPPRPVDIKYWQGEVMFGLMDVDHVVGVVKGMGRAFQKAMLEGDYGELSKANVLGDHGVGGNVARLLNDLEEAIWYVSSRLDLGVEY
jgi:hypothetical protein